MCYNYIERNETGRVDVGHRCNSRFSRIGGLVEFNDHESTILGFLGVAGSTGHEFHLLNEGGWGNQCSLCGTEYTEADAHEIPEWEIRICPDCYNDYSPLEESMTLDRPVQWKGKRG